MAKARVLSELIDGFIEFEEGEIVQALWCNPQTGECLDAEPDDGEGWELYLQTENASRWWEFSDSVSDDVEILTEETRQDA